MWLGFNKAPLKDLPKDGARKKIDTTSLPEAGGRPHLASATSLGVMIVCLRSRRFGRLLLFSALVWSPEILLLRRCFFRDYFVQNRLTFFGDPFFPAKAQNGPLSFTKVSLRRCGLASSNTRYDSSPLNGAVVLSLSGCGNLFFSSTMLFW